MQNESSFPERGVNELFSELWSIYVARVVRLLIISFASAITVYAALFCIDAVMPVGTQPQVDAILAAVPEGQSPTEEQLVEIAGLEFQDLPLDIIRTALVLTATLCISAIAAGAYIYVVGAHYVIGRVPITEPVAFAFLRIGGLVITTCMALFGVFLAWGALFMLPFFIANQLADVAALAALFGLLSFTGLIAAAVISVYVLIRWTFIWPVVALNGMIGLPALRKSWELTEGHWWRTFGIMLIVVLAAFAVAFPGVFLTGFGVAWVADIYMNLVAPTIAGPIQAIMIFLLYADLRTRKEGPPGYGAEHIRQELNLRPEEWGDVL